MACTVNITFDSNHQLHFEGLVELSDSPMESIAQALYNDLDKREQIISSFNNLYRNKKIKASGQIGNISYSSLSRSIPIEGGWPIVENIQGFNPDEYNILYIDSEGTQKPERYAPVEVGDGKKIQVMVVYRNQLHNFRNWILSNILVENLDPNTQFSKEFEAVQKSIGKTPKQILKSYLLGEYEKEPSVNFGGRFLNIESVVEGEILSLQDKVQKRKYSNELFNAIATKLKFSRSSNGDMKYSIPVSEFDRLAQDLLQDKPELLKEVEDMKPRKKIETILQNLLKTDPDFPYRVSSVSGNIANFNRVFLSINEKYGLNFKQAQNQFTFVEEYKGFDIYTYKGKYYFTKGIVMDDSSLEPYVSKEDVFRKINEKLKTSKLNTSNIQLKNANEGLYYVETEQKYKVGQVIKSMDVSVNTRVNLNQDETALVSNGTLQDFYNYINSTTEFSDPVKARILEEIDTPEKAAIFLYKTSEGPAKKILDRNAEGVLDQIQQAGYKYFYVAHGDSPYHIRVKQIDMDSIRNLKDTQIKGFESQDLPKAQIILEFSKAIQARLEGTGFQVELLTQDEISKDSRFAGVQANAKAFIKGNSIVINTTTADISDPLHEYAHIFLGLIKAQNFDMYQKLIEDVLSKRNPKEVARLRREKAKLYGNLSQIDLEEEVFAEIYSKFIMNNHYSDFVDFANVRKIVEGESQTIWDMLSPDSKVVKLGDIWNEPLGALTNMNSDMLVGLASQESPQDRFKVYRQASNWIEQKIKDKEIVENCR